MKSRDKVKGADNRSRGIAKPKTLTVAEGSLQTRAPGYVMPGGFDTPFTKSHTGSMQSDISSRNGAQAAGWSARQQAQRIQARGEQDRLDQSRQSASGSGSQQGVSDALSPQSGSSRKG